MLKLLCSVCPYVCMCIPGIACCIMQLHALQRMVIYINRNKYPNTRVTFPSSSSIWPV